MDSVNDKALTRVGSVLLDKWTLVELVGVGGMGSVYRARHRNGNRVAIKILHAHLTQQRSLVARFEREARLANQIDHPGVVRVHDDGKTDDGCPFLVTEWLDGQTLEDCRVAAGGQLPTTDVIIVGRQLLEILEVAHANGVIHRDIKPQNLMRTPQGELKVLDFGLGRETEPDDEGLTSDQTVLGTVGFMAPEQAQGRWDLVDEQTDVWAVGATLLKLASGLDAHEGDTSQQRLALAATQPIAPLAPRAPGIPQPIARVLEKAMAYSKRDRYPSASAMLEAMSSLERGDSKAPVATPQSGRIRILFGVLLLIVAVGIAWSLQRCRGSSISSASVVPSSTAPFAPSSSPPFATQSLSVTAGSSAPASSDRPVVPGTGARHPPALSGASSTPPATQTTVPVDSADPLDRRR